MKKYIGKNRAENLAWLLNTWLKEGPSVCFLQGFSGVGKTDLARDFRALAEQQQSPDKKPRWQQAVINEIADRATPSVLESLMELSLVLSQQGLPEMEQILFEQKLPNPAFALEKALQRPVVIILDEAQRFFRDDTGAPLPEMNSILNFLRSRPNLPGRLLLLSDRIIEEARWSEWIPKRTLARLEPDEAIEALNAKLEEAEVVADMSVERKREVVRDLDYNPRAIEALVGALRNESLDEIIQSNPGLWAIHDREISRDFLKALERDLLERTLRHLAEPHQRKLWRLAVHRRSFKREALEKLCATKDEASELRIALVCRYLVNFYKSALSLNPIVREIALGHLREKERDFRQAHSAAADYHQRHFKAQQMVGSESKLGMAFAELRYHLVQAGREAELKDIGKRFTDHLKEEIKSGSPAPADREELDERIGVLTVLLEDGGAKGLEYHLARCLQARSKRGDIEQAVIHAERATGEGAAECNWTLLAKLKLRVEGADSAIRTILHALQTMDDLYTATPLYYLGAEILSGIDKNDDAVTLLQEGIKVPGMKDISSLYQCCAEVLDRAGRTEEAVALLKDGIKISWMSNPVQIYQICAEILDRAGKPDEAVALLKDGIKVIPVDKGLSSLYQTCADLLAKSGKTDEAVALLKVGIKVIPVDKGLSSLYQILGEVFCRAGKIDDAIASQREGIGQCSTNQSGYGLAETAINLCAAANATQTLDDILAGTGAAAIVRQQGALGSVIQHLLREDWRAAADAANAARQEFPRYFPLATLEAYSRLCAGDAEAAWQALTSFPNLTFSPGNTHGWLLAFIHLRRGTRAEAASALETYLRRATDEARELNESFLLRLWDGQEASPENHRLCFHFPIMPSSLTGLGYTVRRVQFGKPVLPPAAGAVAGSTVAAPAVTASSPTEVYVSYSWGEDSTEAGRQREEIVDRLCATVTATGRVIGRDKERMKGGDSIERFGHEISKAQRIIAVISEKSLHSEFCMAHELFRAFRRCDYQRLEFQEKVIALVMDDAKPLLKDHSAIIALAAEWKLRLEKLRSELQAIDSNRKSPHLWVYLDMVDDMCPRLPDMLGALADIVMKRGFDEITADGFKQVIERLPAS